MPENQIIHVVVQGGVVQDVLNVPPGIEVHVIDYDVDSQHYERLEPSPFDGKPCSIAVYSQPASPVSTTNSRS